MASNKHIMDTSHPRKSAAQLKEEAHLHTLRDKDIGEKIAELHRKKAENEAQRVLVTEAAEIQGSLEAAITRAQQYYRDNVSQQTIDIMKWKAEGQPAAARALQEAAGVSEESSKGALGIDAVESLYVEAVSGGRREFIRSIAKRVLVSLPSNGVDVKQSTSQITIPATNLKPKIAALATFPTTNQASAAVPIPENVHQTGFSSGRDALVGAPKANTTQGSPATSRKRKHAQLTNRDHPLWPIKWLQRDNGEFELEIQRALEADDATTFRSLVTCSKCHRYSASLLKTTLTDCGHLYCRTCLLAMRRQEKLDRSGRGVPRSHSIVKCLFPSCQAWIKRATEVPTEVATAWSDCISDHLGSWRRHSTFVPDEIGEEEEMEEEMEEEIEAEESESVGDESEDVESDDSESEDVKERGIEGEDVVAENIEEEDMKKDEVKMEDMTKKDNIKAEDMKDGDEAF